MARGFVCLAVVLDGGSRRGRAWRRSIPLTVDVCLEVVEEALTRLGRPEMVTTDQGSTDQGSPDQGSPDQGSQVTAGAFLALRLANRIAIRRDGKGSWRDTVFDKVFFDKVFVERLWRAVKDEEVYLKGDDSGAAARASIGDALDFDNAKRPHSSRDGQTPDRAYFNTPPQAAAA